MLRNPCTRSSWGWHQFFVCKANWRQNFGSWLFLYCQETTRASHWCWDLSAQGTLEDYVWSVVHLNSVNIQLSVLQIFFPIHLNTFVLQLAKSLRVTAGSRLFITDDSVIFSWVSCQFWNICMICGTVETQLETYVLISFIKCARGCYLTFWTK